MAFQGKIALVTGAASGIGEATTRLLVERGAKVLAVDINASGLDKLAAELGAAVLAHRADMSIRSEVENMVRSVVEKFGALDVLVNNAGIGSLSPVTDLDPAEWRKVMAIDLDAVFWASRVALPHLMERGGCIVNTASISGMGADYGFAAYNTAKSGVIALTRTMAIEHAARGVRVNSVSPGYVLTQITAPMRPETAQKFISRIPMLRAGRAEEIASVIAFLASEEASFITGQNVAVDGGVTAHTGQPDVIGFDAMATSP